MLQRLNGWQRLWFVIAILGLLYAAWFALADGAKYYGFKGEVLLEFDRPACKTVVEMPAGHELVPEPGLDSPCWNLYLYRSIYTDARSNPQAYVEHMGSLQRWRALETFGFTFVVWLASITLNGRFSKLAKSAWGCLRTFTGRISLPAIAHRL